MNTINPSENKVEIIGLLKETHRLGVEGLIDYLDKKSDFFTAPASTDFHGNVDGGLADHSLKVYKILESKVHQFNLETPKDSIIICGLMHDICKTGFYSKGIKSVVDGRVMKDFPLEKDTVSGKVLRWGKREVKNWVDKEIWEIDDKFPAGHGEKSVFILQRYISLTDEEILAIRWHMVAFDPGIHFNYPSGFPFRKAIKEYPLVTLLFTSDFEVSNVIEKAYEDFKKIETI